MSEAVVDLTNTSDTSEGEATTVDTKRVRETNKRKVLKEKEELHEVWVVVYQLEAGGYGCVGYANHNLHFNPTTFDSEIKGIFRTRGDANNCALEICLDEGLIDDEVDDIHSERDFVGDGFYISGAERTGDCNTYSQRVFVMRHDIL